MGTQPRLFAYVFSAAALMLQEQSGTGDRMAHRTQKYSLSGPLQKVFQPLL